MSEIKNLKPECLWSNFDLLTQVPRPSGHLAKIQQFLLDWAASRNIEAFQDVAGNIIMRKPATPGREGAKTVIMQAHMDMVPQKEINSAHDFENDPILPRIDGEWVKATGTTLGADDGLGVAAIMAVMESTDIKHGPLEALITADEETGMYGANDLPEGILKGEILLNLDTETEGEMVVGSAGGIDIDAAIDYQEVDTDPTDTAVKVTVKGLKGGHSGLEIGLGRANANKLLVRIVREAIAEDEARLASWECGNMRNAIPFEGSVVLTLPADNVADLKEMASAWAETFNGEYSGIEDAISVLVEEVSLPEKQVPTEIQDNLVDAIYAVHNGVWRYIPSIPDTVETSSNLAIISIGQGKAAVKILGRSASETMKHEMTTSIISCFSMAGMKVECSGEYGGWDPNPNSEIVAVMKGIYSELFGEDAKVVVVHAGLECSVILSKYPGLDICSFGPTLLSPHTSNERAYWPSSWKFWELLKTTLERI